MSEGFPLKIRKKQEYVLSPLLYNIVLEVLVNVIRREKEIEVMQIGKKGIKVSLFEDDMVICRKSQGIY